MEKQERNYGIDLLRIVSMFMVVMLHVIGHAGGMASSQPFLSVKGELIWALEIACYCAVNCYALISGYVGVKAKHKYSNLIYLWLQVLFYSVLSTVIISVVNIANGISISIMDLLKSFFPVATSRYWYFTAYFCLFLFIPILNHVLHTAPRKMLKSGLIAVIVLFCIVDGIQSVRSFGLEGGYSFLWLAVLYLIGGYISKYEVLKKYSAKRCFLIYFLCVAIICCSRIVIGLLTQWLLGSVRYENLLLGYQDFFVTACAVCLLIGFSKLKIGAKTAKVISWISPLSFGVYLIHLTPFVWGWLKGRFAFFADYNVFVTIGLIFAAVIAIYTICMAIDFVRLQVFKLLKIKKFSVWLEKMIGKCITFILRIFHLSLKEESTTEPLPNNETENVSATGAR